jgi:hypothetical protein
MRHLLRLLVAVLAFAIGVAVSPIRFELKGMGCGKMIDGGGGFGIRTYRSSDDVELYFASGGYASTEKTNEGPTAGVSFQLTHHRCGMFSSSKNASFTTRIPCSLGHKTSYAKDALYPQLVTHHSSRATRRSRGHSRSEPARFQSGSGSQPRRRATVQRRRPAFTGGLYWTAKSWATSCTAPQPSVRIRAPNRHASA